MKFITWWQHFVGLRSDVATENDYRANYDGDDNDDDDDDDDDGDDDDDDDDDDGGDGFQNGKSDCDVIFNVENKEGWERWQH